MKNALREIQSALAESPVLWLSLVCCIWVYVRVMFYQFGISRRGSIIELTLVTLIGAMAGLGALLRNREQAWYLGLVTVVLNVAAWWLRLMQIDWAALRSSFDS